MLDLLRYGLYLLQQFLGYGGFSLGICLVKLDSPNKNGYLVITLCSHRSLNSSLGVFKSFLRFKLYLPRSIVPLGNDPRAPP